ncbi:MAG: KH domain-containing protein [Deltaproteobacteria bacterium]|nr:KH domain-containing protein [Deltaproteobacteria bacterium]
MADKTEAERGQEYLTEILKLMGYQGDVTVHEGEDRLTLEVKGEDVGQLIGRKGATLDALQLLVAKMVTKGAETTRPIVVDVAGYREQRNGELLAMAAKKSDEAIKTGRVIALEPMSAHDRRVIHVALTDTPGVTTRSEGEGVNRRLMIVPTGPGAAS